MMSHATAANTAANRNQPASLNVRREIHGLRLLLSSSVISFGAPRADRKPQKHGWLTR